MVTFLIDFQKKGATQSHLNVLKFNLVMVPYRSLNKKKQMYQVHAA